MKDVMKTWFLTLKSQLFTGLLMCMVTLMLWNNIPLLEYGALQRFVQWQQQHESKLVPQTVIVGLDDAALPTLKKRFGIDEVGQNFYKRLMGDLHSLEVPHIVLDVNQTGYYDIQDLDWPYPNLQISQGFTSPQMANVPPLLSYDHLGIRRSEFNHQHLDRHELLYPLVYSAKQVGAKNLYRQAVDYYPSLGLSGVLQQFNSSPHVPKATWIVSSEKEGLQGGLELSLRHDRIKSFQSNVTKANNRGEVLLRWYQNKGYYYNKNFSTRKIVKVSDLYKSSNLDALTTIRRHSIVLTDLTASGMQTMPTVLHAKHLEADVIATAMDNILQQQSIKPAPLFHEWILMAVMGLLCLSLRLFIRRTGLPHILLLATLSIYALFSFIMPYFFSVLYPFVSPLICGILGFILAEFFWRTLAEKDLRNLELNMTQLVPESVLKQVKMNKSRLEAGGKRLNITSMFVDIRNFTKLSENLPPMEVTEILNAWYTEVEHVANEYRGTVDKFLGDGALVMFGAPIESAQHADMALRAARHLIRSSQEMAEKWQKERNIEFSVGVSINSGYAFVGFIGPKNKLEYTAIGDTINTSSRLQDAAKQYHTQVIFSESTLKQCVNIDFDAGIQNLGEYKVRGKEMMIATYTFDDMYVDGYTFEKVTQENKNAALEAQLAQIINQPPSSSSSPKLETSLPVQPASSIMQAIHSPVETEFIATPLSQTISTEPIAAPPNPQQPQSIRPAVPPGKSPLPISTPPPNPVIPVVPAQQVQAGIIPTHHATEPTTTARQTAPTNSLPQPTAHSGFGKGNLPPLKSPALNAPRWNMPKTGNTAFQGQAWNNKATSTPETGSVKPKTPPPPEPDSS
jgi:class 3 adenylate cyclase